MHNSEKVVKKVDVVRMVEDTIEEANVGELSFVDTIQILEEHVEGMSENQVDSSIANQDDIFEYIIHEDENISRVFSNVDFESTRNCTNNTTDSEDSHDENTTVKGGQYYEEGNLDDNFSQLNLSNLTIHEPLKYTYNNEYFIWQDSGYGDPQRVFIFATEANIKLLASYNEWYMDGTFEVSPLIYKQMYNIVNG